MIEPRLRALLVAVGPSAAGRVYPQVLPQRPTYPALTYAQVSDPRFLTHDGSDGLVEARYQVSAWSPKYEEMLALAEEVRGGLHGFVGTMNGHSVASVRYEGGPDRYEPDVGPAGTEGLHHGPRDYVIQYQD